MDERKRKVFVRGVIIFCVLPIAIALMIIIWNAVTKKDNELVVREDEIITKDGSDSYYRFANYVLHGDDKTDMIVGTGADYTKAYFLDIDLTSSEKYEKHFKELATAFRKFALDDKTYGTGNSLGYYLRVTGEKSQLVESIRYDSPYYTEQELYSWYIALGSEGVQDKLSHEYAAFKAKFPNMSRASDFITAVANRDNNLVTMFNLMLSDGCISDTFGSWKEGDQLKSFSDAISCEKMRDPNQSNRALLINSALAQSEQKVLSEISINSYELVMNIYSVAAWIQVPKK